VTPAERTARMETALRLGGDLHAVPDVVAAVKDGRAQFWGRDDGMVVTELQVFPSRRVLNYWLVAGRLRDCLALEPEIEAWALDHGASVATANGLPKWGHVGGRIGWREWHLRNYWKPLTEEGQAYGQGP
jgi:hypothetical protein